MLRHAYETTTPSRQYQGSPIFVVILAIVSFVSERHCRVVMTTDPMTNDVENAKVNRILLPKFTLFSKTAPAPFLQPPSGV